MRATCGRERGGSGQANKNKEVCRCGGVSAWRDVRMDAGVRAGRARRRCRREWHNALRGAGGCGRGAGGGRHLRQRECVAAAATDQALRVRDSQQTVAREARKHAGGMWLGAGRKWASK